MKKRKGFGGSDGTRYKCVGIPTIVIRKARSLDSFRFDYTLAGVLAGCFRQGVVVI